MALGLPGKHQHELFLVKLWSPGLDQHSTLRGFFVSYAADLHYCPMDALTCQCAQRHVCCGKVHIWPACSARSGRPVSGSGTWDMSDRPGPSKRSDEVTRTVPEWPALRELHQKLGIDSHIYLDEAYRIRRPPNLVCAPHVAHACCSALVSLTRLPRACAAKLQSISGRHLWARIDSM